jgi:general stress protein YciG
MLNSDNQILEQAPVKNVEEGRPSASLRGFAAMSVEVRREIASKGGKAAHEKGTAHEFTSEEARQAGHKGGLARQSR